MLAGAAPVEFLASGGVTAVDVSELADGISVGTVPNLAAGAEGFGSEWGRCGGGQDGDDTSAGIVDGRLLGGKGAGGSCMRPYDSNRPSGGKTTRESTSSQLSPICK